MMLNCMIRNLNVLNVSTIQWMNPKNKKSVEIWKRFHFLFSKETWFVDVSKQIQVHFICITFQIISNSPKNQTKSVWHSYMMMMMMGDMSMWYVHFWYRFYSSFFLFSFHSPTLHLNCHCWILNLQCVLWTFNNNGKRIRTLSATYDYYDCCCYYQKSIIIIIIISGRNFDIFFQNTRNSSCWLFLFHSFLLTFSLVVTMCVFKSMFFFLSGKVLLF